MANNPPQPLVDYEDDSDYASAEDDDFNPDADTNDEPTAAASASEDDASDSEDDSAPAAQIESETKKPTKRKRAKVDNGDGQEAEDVGFENSGDEAIIGKGLRKAKRRKRKEEESEDEGGEGGFVRTRRMAALAEEERAPLVTTDKATVDVDALYASMLAQPIFKRPSVAALLPTVDGAPAESAAPVSQTAAAAASTLTTIPNPAEENDTVTIHRTYQFAGKTHTETKIVPRNSAEARLYLASNPEGKEPSAVSPPRRKLKIAFRSRFEPPSTFVPRADLKLGVGTIRERLTMTKEDKGKKLNTVEKSKMDWAGYVDQEGLREDLEKAEKDKGSYLQRREFLDRVEGKREEEARRVRLGGKPKVG